MPQSNQIRHWFVAVIGAALCCFGLWQSARLGAARTVAQHAVLMNDRVAAERSVRWLPHDATTHISRGIVLQRTQDYPGAIAEFERSVQLRPLDYFPWMLLGVSRDLNGDQAGAVRALRQSIALAPAYAQPHWLLGNLLLRTRQIDEAFRELRFAANTDPALLPNVIDLAWGINDYDPPRVIAAIQPGNDRAHLALAIYFAIHQQGAAALDQFRAVAKPSEEAGNRLVAELIKAKQFVQANEVWTRTHGTGSNPAQLLNGDFEDEVAVGKTGFGWQIPNDLSNVTMSVDGSQFQSGARSLRVDFQGNAEPSTPLLSQLLIVKPNGRYRLTFKAMAKDLVSAAPPILVVSNAGDDKRNAIAQSAPLTNSGSWQEIVVEFSAPANGEAVWLALTRQSCAASTCAAFGTLWLDSFRLDVK